MLTLSLLAQGCIMPSLIARGLRGEFVHQPSGACHSPFHEAKQAGIQRVRLLSSTSRL